MIEFLVFSLALLWVALMYFTVMSGKLGGRIKDSLVEEHGKYTFYLGAIALYLAPLLLMNGLPRGDSLMVVVGASGVIVLGGILLRAAIKVLRQKADGSVSKKMPKN